MMSDWWDYDPYYQAAFEDQWGDGEDEDDMPEQDPPGAGDDDDD